MLRELRITGKLVHADGVARRVEVRYYNMHIGLARIDGELELTTGRTVWREHDLPVTALEALLHAHSLIRFLVDLVSETFLVLRAIYIHSCTSCRLYGVVQRTSPFEAEALGDDPGLPSLDLGSTGAVGASCGEEEGEAHAVASVVSCSGAVVELGVRASYDRMAAAARRRYRHV